MKTPHQLADGDTTGCDKITYRIKCNCPFNLEARKIFYDKYQSFKGKEDNLEQKETEE